MSLCLNVGCHDIHLKDFVNIDLDPAMKPDLVLDATKLPTAFAPGTVDFIYCGHFLEHLSIEQGKQVAKDFFSLLRDYGSVEIVVPDYSKIPANATIEEREGILLADGQHKSLMDIHRLRQYLTEAGFTTIVEAQDLRQLPHCLFPQVAWQTAVLAVKHPKAAHISPWHQG